MNRKRWTVVGVLFCILVLSVFGWFEDDAPADPAAFRFDIEGAPPEFPLYEFDKQSSIYMLADDSHDELRNEAEKLGRDLTWEERQAVLAEYFQSDWFHQEHEGAVRELASLRPRPDRDRFPGGHYLESLTVLCDRSVTTEEWVPWLEQALETVRCSGIGVTIDDEPLDPLRAWLELSIVKWGPDRLRAALAVWPEEPFVEAAREIATWERAEYDRWRDDLGARLGIDREQGLEEKELDRWANRYNFKPQRTRNAYLREIGQRVESIARGEPPTLPEWSEVAMESVTWRAICTPNGLGSEVRREFQFISDFDYMWRQLGLWVELWRLLENSIRVRLFALERGEWDGDLGDVPGFRTSPGVESQRFDRAKGLLISPFLENDRRDLEAEIANRPILLCGSRRSVNGTIVVLAPGE